MRTVCFWCCLMCLALSILSFSLLFNYWKQEALHDKRIIALCQLINVADVLKQRTDKLELLKRPDWQSDIYPQIKQGECRERVVLLNGAMIDIFGNSYLIAKDGEKLMVLSDLSAYSDEILMKHFVVALKL
ncbi:hypothetical protein [Pseudoalteromonas rubra]|uniref:hypothetical protein n=1 Tax=Pseudoalteromonas rubra TaxID=43658 RepID=UPI002DBC5418|nr:hypothetical protein [Pseudoalteromonas rubra]MEC4088720.1 hypothetical protein [Pseudoalteromonas rubra]